MTCLLPSIKQYDFCELIDSGIEPMTVTKSNMLGHVSLGKYIGVILNLIYLFSWVE